MDRSEIASHLMRAPLLPDPTGHLVEPIVIVLPVIHIEPDPDGDLAPVYSLDDSVPVI
jgi:hypothetical protein